MSDIFFVIAISPFVIYIFAAYSQSSSRTDFLKFLNPHNSISAEEFSQSSTAYNLQVASLSFFVAVGFFYPLAGFINALAWGAGIILFYSAIPKMHDFITSNSTLHGFLQERYQSSILRKITALATVIGFLLFIVAELVFGSLILSTFGFSDFQVKLLTFSIGLFIAAYYSIGGHLSTIRTDLYQLNFAYVGILSIFVFLIYNISKYQTLDTVPFIFFVILLMILSVFSGTLAPRMYAVRSSHYSNDDRSKRLLVNSIKAVFTVFLALVLCLVIYYFVSSANRSISDSKNSSEFFSHLFSLEGLDYVSLLSSFILVPLVWQFSDTSNWHRLGNVYAYSSSSNNEYSNISELPKYSDEEMRLGFLRYSRLSPATIVFSVLMGVGLFVSTLDISPSAAFDAIYLIPSLMTEGGVVNTTIATLFIIAVIAIMLSTADSLLSSAVFTAMYDIFPSTRRIISKYPSNADIKEAPSSETEAVYKSAVFAAFAFITVSLGLYYALEDYTIVPILFGAFSAQIAFAPAVLSAIYLPAKYLNKSFACLSVVSGLATAMFFSISASLGISVDNLSWFGYFLSLLGVDGLDYISPIMTLFIASLFLGIGIALKVRKSFGGG